MNINVSPSNESQCGAEIVRKLGELTPGFTSKLTHKGYNTAARLELRLPESVSCDRAEKDTLTAIEAASAIYGKVYVKSHGGATLVSSHDGFEKWIDINPMGTGWFGPTHNM